MRTLWSRVEGREEWRSDWKQVSNKLQIIKSCNKLSGELFERETLTEAKDRKAFGPKLNNLPPNFYQPVRQLFVCFYDV